MAAKDAEIAGLQAEADAARERERRLELRLAALERRLGMDSTDSGTPSSKERIGAKEARRVRQQSERECSKDRKRGGQPGHQGKGLLREPDPDERKDAEPPAECRACKASLDRAEAVRPRWAQVIDVEVIRIVTEWLLPGLACPCCGAVTFAPRRRARIRARCPNGPVLNAAAVLLACYGNVPAERAAQVMGMLLGVQVSAGWVDKAAARGRGAARQGRVRRGDDRGAGRGGRAGRRRDPGERRGQDRPGTGAGGRERRQRPGREGREDGYRGAARADHPDPGRAADVPAGPRIPPQGRPRRRAAGLIHRVPDHRRLHRLPAPSFPAAPASSSAPPT